jgi:hypothetical protein
MWNDDLFYFHYTDDGGILISGILFLILTFGKGDFDVAVRAFYYKTGLLFYQTISSQVIHFLFFMIHIS